MVTEITGLIVQERRTISAYNIATETRYHDSWCVVGFSTFPIHFTPRRFLNVIVTIIRVELSRFSYVRWNDYTNLSRK